MRVTAPPDGLAFEAARAQAARTSRTAASVDCGGRPAAVPNADCPGCCCWGCAPQAGAGDAAGAKAEQKALHTSGCRGNHCVRRQRVFACGRAACRTWHGHCRKQLQATSSQNHQAKQKLQGRRGARATPGCQRAAKKPQHCYQEAAALLPRIRSTATKKPQHCYQEAAALLPRSRSTATKKPQHCQVATLPLDTQACKWSSQAGLIGQEGSWAGFSCMAHSPCAGKSQVRGSAGEACVLCGSHGAKGHAAVQGSECMLLFWQQAHNAAPREQLCVAVPKEGAHEGAGQGRNAVPC